MIEINILVNKQFSKNEVYLCFNGSMINNFLYKSNIEKTYKKLEYNINSLSIYDNQGIQISTSLAGSYEVYMYFVNKFHPVNDINLLREKGIVSYTKHKIYETYGFVRTDDELINTLVYLKGNNLLRYNKLYEVLYEKYKTIIEEETEKYINQDMLIGSFLRLPYINYKGIIKFDYGYILLE